MNAVERVKSKLHIRLSQAQETALLATVAYFRGRRPEYYEYSAKIATLKAIPVEDKAVFANVFANVIDKAGKARGDIVPLPGFNAATDIAEGWCLYPWYDSGNNHHLLNAAHMAWTTIWNYWETYVPNQKEVTV